MRWRIIVAHDARPRNRQQRRCISPATAILTGLQVIARSPSAGRLTARRYASAISSLVQNCVALVARKESSAERMVGVVRATSSAVTLRIAHSPDVRFLARTRLQPCSQLLGQTVHCFARTHRAIAWLIIASRNSRARRSFICIAKIHARRKYRILSAFMWRLLVSMRLRRRISERGRRASCAPLMCRRPTARRKEMCAIFLAARRYNSREGNHQDWRAP